MLEREKSRIRSSFDAATSVVLMVAAGLVIWHTFKAGPQPGPPRGRPGLRIGNLKNEGLSTTVNDAPGHNLGRAKVALIEFSDFECPFCARYETETFGKLQTEFIANGRIQYIFRHFPLEHSHPHALAAARAADCAGDQHRFWEMRAKLFEKQSDLSSSVWLREGATIGLEAGAFERCLRESRSDRIKADFAEGSRLGVSSTPTFFIGEADDKGVVHLLSRIRGAQPVEVFEEALDKALNPTAQEPQKVGLARLEASFEQQASRGSD